MLYFAEGILIVSHQTRKSNQTISLSHNLISIFVGAIYFVAFLMGWDIRYLINMLLMTIHDIILIFCTSYSVINQIYLYQYSFIFWTTKSLLSLFRFFKLSDPIFWSWFDCECGERISDGKFMIESAFNEFGSWRIADFERGFSWLIKVRVPSLLTLKRLIEIVLLFFFVPSIMLPDVLITGWVLFI